MPTYDYVCETCGNRFEEWQKITDEPNRICPVCGGPVHRIIYPVGLVFKGGGFYKTDNRAAPPAESSATGASDATSAEANGTDHKAAASASGSDAGSPKSDGAGQATASAASKSE